MKKSSWRQFWKGLFWFSIIAVALGLAIAPKRVRHHAPVLQVAVKPLVEPEAPPEVPSELPTAQVVQVTPQTPPPPAMSDGAAAVPPAVGDEKSQVQETFPVAPPSRMLSNEGSKQPRLAIVIDDMGLDLRGSKRATKLPGFITLSYMPYAVQLKDQTREALDAGHELLLHMPMEPIGHDDPGPGALLVSLSPEEIRRRFEVALGSFTGFDGVNNHMGSKFTSNTDDMTIVVDELQERHLFFLDSRTSAQSVGEEVAREHHLPALARDIFLDDDISLKAIREQLQQAEHLARRKGFAIAIGHPHAITLEALEEWLPEAEARGVIFIPLHNVLEIEHP